MSTDIPDTIKSISGTAITGASVWVSNSADLLPVVQIIAAFVAIAVGTVTFIKTCQSIARNRREDRANGK